MGVPKSKIPPQLLPPDLLAGPAAPPPRKGFFAGKGQGNLFAKSPVEERTHEGTVFDSKYEMIAFREMQPFVRPEFIQRQAKFLLLPKKVIMTRGKAERMLEMTYKADFIIGPPRLGPEDPVDYSQLVIDIKGHPTPQFEVRLKIFKWRFETIPLIANINSKPKLKLFLETVYKHCQTYNYLK